LPDRRNLLVAYLGAFEVVVDQPLSCAEVAGHVV
jgi:hypothetical protein